MLASHLEKRVWAFAVKLKTSSATPQTVGLNSQRKYIYNVYNHMCMTATPWLWCVFFNSSKINLVEYNYRLQAYEQTLGMNIWNLMSGNNLFKWDWISTEEENGRSALTTPEVITGSSWRGIFREAECFLIYSCWGTVAEHVCGEIIMWCW